MYFRNVKCSAKVHQVSQMCKFYDLGQTQHTTNKMKKYALLLICFFCLSIQLHAQVKNFVSAWGNLGEASLLTKTDVIDPQASLGIGGGLGVGYELHANKFLFTVGVGANVSHSAFSYSVQNGTIFDQVDDEGHVFDFVYSQTARKDAYTNVALQVPVMAGAQFNRFFFLAGVKLDVSMLVLAKTEAHLSSYGVYDMFIDPFTGMPDHMFYPDVTLGSKPQKLGSPFDFNVMGSVEIGWQLGEIYKGTGWDVPKPKHHFRLSLFADYGFLDLVQYKGSNLFLAPPAPDPETGIIKLDGLQVNHLLSTNSITKAVNNLMVGIKFTALFELPSKRNCVICRESDTFFYNDRVLR